MPLQVYAVWYRMLPSDAMANRFVFPDRLMPDERVRHFWNENRSIGRWFEDHVTRLGEPGEERIEWDVYLLFEPEVVWSRDPPVPASWGRTIIDTADNLSDELDALGSDFSGVTLGKTSP